jgi:hypothetical protein
MTVPAGTVVFDERQPCQGFPFMKRQHPRHQGGLPSGRELPLYRVTPGETCLITSSCLLGRNRLQRPRRHGSGNGAGAAAAPACSTSCWPAGFPRLHLPPSRNAWRT